jgi:hypothetical protein
MQAPTLDSPIIGHTIFVPENIIFSREEDLAFPEGERSQPEQHYPYRAHHDSHDGMQDKEAWDSEGVAENAQTRDPAHVRERQGPAYVKDNKSGSTEVKRERERVLTSKDLAEVLVDFEPVWQQAKCEKEDGKAEEEKSNKHARGEPDFAGERRDEIVQRKAVPE